MLDFDVINPTRILFGTSHYQKLSTLITTETSKKKIMLAYGGGSIFQNGVYQKVSEHLADFEIVQFGGIEANPQFTTLMKAVEICQTQDIDFILAVGGGSVIDGVKFISGAAKYSGDPWEVLMRLEGKNFTEALSFGTVLTLPATGSEANSGAVISRQELQEKRTMGGPLFFPKFSLCDPTVVASLPQKQIANGIVDSFMHTMEQYLTHPTDNFLQEKQAEALLTVLIEVGPKVMKEPSNHVYASNLMWCATNALNGQLRLGVPTDWCTHMIGHELTAHFGIDHARTLAIIAPRLYENQLHQKMKKLVQYGKIVWKLAGADLEIAQTAIHRTEQFFQSLGISTKISDYASVPENYPQIVQSSFEDRGWIAMGENQSILPADIFQIVKNAM